MKYLVKFITLLFISIGLIGCKKEGTLSEYKYSTQEYPVLCEGVDLKLLQEAVYSFENDITTYFGNKGSKNLSQAYARTINLTLFGRAKYTEIVSAHTKEIFNILKQDEQMWREDGSAISLNYDSKFVQCLANNITNKELQTTFKALLSTNSMSAKLFGEPLRRSTHLALRDKYLATYIALDFYYAKLFDVDFEVSETKNTNKKDPHAGHNH